MNARLVTFLAFVLPLSSMSGRSYWEAPELEKFFTTQGVQGTFALLDSSTDAIIVSSETRAKQRFTYTFFASENLYGLTVIEPPPK